MTNGKAAAAEFVNYRLIPSRSVAQLVFEIPIQQTDEVIALLGGSPQPEKSRWVAIAPLIGSFGKPEAPKEVPKEEPEKLELPEAKPEPRPFKTLTPAQQAGIRCTDPLFHAFLRDVYGDKIIGVGDVNDASSAAKAVRRLCIVGSRRELGVDPAATGRWFKLDYAFVRWSRAPLEPEKES